MDNQGKIRTPKQKRSIEKKQLVKKTTRELMCSCGYHNITTNQIAKEANISIGSLYEYYSNKDAILEELLNDYFEELLDSKYQITEMIMKVISSADRKSSLTLMLRQQIASHRASAAFNRELHILYYSVPVVTKVCTDQKNMLRQMLYNALLVNKDDLKIDDIESATYLLMDQIDSMIDRVTFYPLPFDEERYISVGVTAICDYLFK